MNEWSKKFAVCQSCGTIRFPHVGRGFCTRCHRLISKLETIDRWDLSDIKTLKGFPGDEIFWKPDTFEWLRNRRRRAIKTRLEYFKIRETQLAEQVDGLDLEYGLNRIARRCGTRNPSILHGYATIFDHNFDSAQKKLLFSIINDIEESLPWKDFSDNTDP